MPPGSIYEVRDAKKVHTTADREKAEIPSSLGSLCIPLRIEPEYGEFLAYASEMNVCISY